MEKKMENGPQWGVEVGVWLGGRQRGAVWGDGHSLPGCGGGYRYKPLSDSLYHTLRMGAGWAPESRLI